MLFIARDLHFNRLNTGIDYPLAEVIVHTEMVNSVKAIADKCQCKTILYLQANSIMNDSSQYSLQTKNIPFSYRDKLIAFSYIHGGI